MPRPMDKPLRSLTKIDLSFLLTNASCLRGDEFYAHIKEPTSDDIEELLRIQKVSNARCLLNTNVSPFFDICSIAKRSFSSSAKRDADEERVIRRSHNNFHKKTKSTSNFFGVICLIKLDVSMFSFFTLSRNCSLSCEQF